MKKSIYLLLTLSIFLFSCERPPVASFAVSDNNVLITEDVYFTNTSIDAASFEWDFGDGTFANAPNVVHNYDQAGIYDVKLTVWSKSGNERDEAYQRIIVLELILEVEVLEYYDKYSIPGASVIAYPTYQDWLDETNWVEEAITDEDGFAVFTDLQSGRRYYLDVWETDHDNYTLAAEDIAFIETDLLIGGRINYFLAYVDYYLPVKSQVERSRDLRGVPKGRKKK